MLSNVSRENGDETLQIFYLGYKFKWMISFKFRPSCREWKKLSIYLVGCWVEIKSQGTWSLKEKLLLTTGNWNPVFQSADNHFTIYKLRLLKTTECMCVCVCFIFNILFKTPTNAQYMLTPIYSLCYTPTCFSPKGDILRDYWYILGAGSTIYVSRCKYRIKEQRIYVSRQLSHWLSPYRHRTPEDRNRVRPWNAEVFSNLEAALCPRRLYWILLLRKLQDWWVFISVVEEYSLQGKF